MHDDILVWFRRDLRVRDHTALQAALADGRRVHAVFVFDTAILGALPYRRDRRVAFIAGCVRELDITLAGLRREAGGSSTGGGLHIVFGDARTVIPALARSLQVAAVYAGRDYEPDAVQRDRAVAQQLAADGRHWQDFTDHVLVEPGTLLTGQGTPYRVFTPYGRTWRAHVAADGLAAPSRRYGLPGHANRLQPAAPEQACPNDPAAVAGFASMTAAEIGRPPGEAAAIERAGDFFARLADYAGGRDYPAQDATSGLSVDLRFGTLSIRALAIRALQRSAAGPAAVDAEKWLSELAWRDFYQGLLAADPALVDHCYRREYDTLAWADWPSGWAAWIGGETGYPIVDAAMRELAAHGTMHNRLRMITASFLCKDLGLDWRLGERHFAAHLLDYDLAANNGGWQWSASTGCDAQPYFRIFNPVSQGERFDPAGHYVRRWLPELARVPDRFVHAPWQMSTAEATAAGCVIGRDYPAPIVDHARARRDTLARFRAVTAT